MFDLNSNLVEIIIIITIIIIRYCVSVKENF